MDSKTRFLMALRHQKPDRVPFNFWMDRRLMDKYEKEIGHRHWRVKHYGADVIETFARLDFPSGKMVEHTGTEWLEEPLFKNWSDAEDIVLPDPSLPEVYALIEQDLREFPDKAVILDMPTAWGIIAGQMRGYENVYMDLYEYEEPFKQLGRRITDIQVRAVEKACQMGITALYLMEDVATSQGLSMSPQMIWEHSFDYARRMKEVADSFGIPTMFHCCGKITDDLMDLFFRLGVDAINPLQPSVNDTKEYAEKYFGKMAVYGAMDNSFIIPQGSPAQVHAHIVQQFELLGKPDGGLIFSSHDLDIKTPRENVEAMISSIKECKY